MGEFIRILSHSLKFYAITRTMVRKNLLKNDAANATNAGLFLRKIIQREFNSFRRPVFSHLLLPVVLKLHRIDAELQHV